MNELINALSDVRVTLEFYSKIVNGECVTVSELKDKNSDLVVAIKVEDNISLKDFIAVYLKPAIDAITVAR